LGIITNITHKVFEYEGACHASAASSRLRNRKQHEHGMHACSGIALTVQQLHTAITSLLASLHNPF
jgi:hypothetical protein